MQKSDYINYRAVVQYSELFGEKITEADFISRLSGLNLRVAIAVISRLFSLQDAVMSDNETEERIQAKEVDSCLRFCHCYRSVISNGGNSALYNSREFLYCPQTLLTLSKWLLAHCTNVGDMRTLNLDDFLEIMDLCLITNDLLPNDIHGHEIEYLFITLFYGTHRNLKSKIARAYHVFIDLMDAIPTTRVFADDFNAKLGYSFEEYFAVLFYTLTLNFTSFDLPSFLGKTLSMSVNDFDAKKLAGKYPLVIKGLASDAQKLKKNAKNTRQKEWDFEFFFLTPLIKTYDSIQSLSEMTLSYHFWEGLYWKVRYLYKEEDIGFLREFGRPFEKYVQWLTDEAVSSSNGLYTYCGEFYYKNGEIRSSDAYMKIGKTLIAIEAKAKSPHSKTLRGYAVEQITTEIEELLIYPVKQIDNRLCEIFQGNHYSNMEGFFSGIDSVIALCVSMEKIQPVGKLLLYADDRLLYTRDEQAKISERIKAYHNINIEDYEVLCNLIEQRVDVSILLVDWFKANRNDNYTAIPLSNYLSTKGYNYTCPKRVDEMFSSIMENLTTRIFGNGSNFPEEQ